MYAVYSLKLLHLKTQLERNTGSPLNCKIQLKCLYISHIVKPNKQSHISTKVQHKRLIHFQFNRTPEYSVGPYNFKESDGENRDPPRLHITYYPHLELHPSKAKYSFHGKPVTGS